MAYSILLVDDSSVAIRIMEKIIKLSGLPMNDIFTAQNGKTAIDILSKNKIDIILTDLNMPVMDGFTFIERVKKIPELSNIPIVIVSTEGRDEYIIKGIKLGASNYIRKPFKPEQIKDIIQKTLDITSSLSDSQSYDELDF